MDTRTDLLIIDEPQPHDDHLASDLKVLINQAVAKANEALAPPHKMGFVKEVDRVYPPADVTGEREVLFRDSRGNHLTAYELDGAIVTLSDGW